MYNLSKNSFYLIFTTLILIVKPLQGSDILTLSLNESHINGAKEKTVKTTKFISEDDKWESLLLEVKEYEKAKTATVETKKRFHVSDFEPHFPTLKKGRTGSSPESKKSETKMEDASSINVIDHSKKLKEKYFTCPEEWANDIIRELTSTSEDSEITSVIEYARECLSYGCLPSAASVAIRRSFEQSQKQIEEYLKSWASIKFVKWPHQTAFHAFMGHVFFPKQFDSIAGASLLIWREGMQDLLSHAAAYGNSLAQFHMVKIYKIYEAEDGEDPDDADDDEVMKHYFNEEALNLLNQYGNENPATCTISLPYHYSGLLASEMNSPSHYIGLTTAKINSCYKDEHFKLGAALDDPWCIYYGSKDRRKLEILHPGMAYFLKLSSDPKERLENLVKAGEYGFVLGFESAANISLKRNNWADALKYYLLAGLNHEPRAYEEAAKIFLQIGDIENALEAYRMQGESGDPHGYLHLGDYYKRQARPGDDNWENNLGEARKWYSKAGYLGFHGLMLCQGIDGMTYEQLKKEKDEYAVKRIEDLDNNSEIIGTSDDN